MKRLLYIGILSHGTTSKMRAEILKDILKDWNFSFIDTDIPKNSMHRIWQSIGFRYKKGPLIRKVNNYIKENISESFYDLIWIDKAIYITPKTTKLLRNFTKKLIHFTPDPAFLFHKSNLFYNSIKYYDFVITTKKFEIDKYSKLISNEKIIYVTQGFSKDLHRPIMEFEEKQGITFIGHYEKERETFLQLLIDNNIELNLAGINWEPFAKKNKHNKNLKYFGSGVYGEDYIKLINKSLIAWGSVSKWIPEKHTTRTFEIPACRTALLTERNEELISFFNEDEVIFYNTKEEMINKIKYYLSHRDQLKFLSNKGYNRVVKDGRDYKSILKKTCNVINVI